MCGIYGIFNRPGSSSDHRELLALNRVRGDLGGGLVSFNNDNSYRQVLRSTCLADVNEARNRGNVVLGHVRAPIGGQTDTVDFLHPFETADFMLAHNGLLLNWYKPVAYGLPNVDSACMLEIIQRTYSERGSVLYAIQLACEELQGQFACWLYHKTTGDVYIWRCMSPLWITHTQEWTSVSSVCPSMPKEGCLVEPLPEGQIRKFSYSDMMFHTVALFSLPEDYPYAID